MGKGYTSFALFIMVKKHSKSYQKIAIPVTLQCNTIQYNSPPNSTTLKVFVETTCFSPPNTKRLDPPGSRDFLISFYGLDHYWTNLWALACSAATMVCLQCAFDMSSSSHVLLLKVFMQNNVTFNLIYFKHVYFRTGLDTFISSSSPSPAGSFFVTYFVSSVWLNATDLLLIQTQQNHCHVRMRFQSYECKYWFEHN